MRRNETKMMSKTVFRLDHNLILLDFCHEYNQPAYQSTHEGMESNFLLCQIRQTHVLLCLVKSGDRARWMSRRNFYPGREKLKSLSH
ncbi:hypothetical protein ACS0PU_013175 [Formica fusca]